MNKLENLPPEIESMKCLTNLYLSANELLELPENIGIKVFVDIRQKILIDVRSLRWGKLTFVASIIPGSLHSLETLKLDENDLLFLPSSIGR